MYIFIVPFYKTIILVRINSFRLELFYYRHGKPRSIFITNPLTFLKNTKFFFIFLHLQKSVLYLFPFFILLSDICPLNIVIDEQINILKSVNIVREGCTKYVPI